MGKINRVLTCVVAVMAGYLGTYSVYMERSGLPWPLGSGGAWMACGLHNRLLAQARIPHAWPMPVQLIRAADLYGGVPYAYASVAAVPACEFVFAAGACPLDQAGKVVAPGDVPGQARQAVANLASALKAAGASLTDVLKTTIYVASGERADLVAAWDAIRAEFGEHDGCGASGMTRQHRGPSVPQGQPVVPQPSARARQLRPRSSTSCVRRLVFAGLAAVQVTVVGCGEIRSLTTEVPM